MTKIDITENLQNTQEMGISYEIEWKPYSTICLGITSNLKKGLSRALQALEGVLGLTNAMAYETR